MARAISIGGPVEELDGQLVLRIPLEVGGRELSEVSRGIAEIQGDFLVVVIPPWLAEKLRLVRGNHVIVDNVGGKFNIRNDDPDT